MSTQLHMKLITSLCFVIQQFQVHQIFVFYVFYCNLKEKDQIRRIINNNKKKKCLYVKSVLLLF